jgi:hypothetical protein
MAGGEIHSRLRRTLQCCELFVRRKFRDEVASRKHAGIEREFTDDCDHPAPRDTGDNSVRLRLVGVEENYLIGFRQERRDTLAPK